MTTHDVRRDRIVGLRAQERDIVQAIEALTQELAHVRAQQASETALLVRQAQREFRVPVVATTPTARSTLVKLRVFTIGNAMSRLNWNRRDVKKLVDAMLSEGDLELAGRFEGKQTFRYVGPPVDIEPEVPVEVPEVPEPVSLSQPEPYLDETAIQDMGRQSVQRGTPVRTRRQKDVRQNLSRAGARQKQKNRDREYERQARARKQREAQQR